MPDQCQFHHDIITKKTQWQKSPIELTDKVHFSYVYLTKNIQLNNSYNEAVSTITTSINQWNVLKRRSCWRPVRLKPIAKGFHCLWLVHVKDVHGFWYLKSCRKKWNLEHLWHLLNIYPTNDDQYVWIVVTTTPCSIPWIWHHQTRYIIGFVLKWPTPWLPQGCIPSRAQIVFLLYFVYCC